MMATRQGTLLWNQKTDSITQLTKTYGAVNFLRMANGFLEGSESGLREFDFNGRLKHHFKADKQQKNSLQANVIKCIFQDSKNRIWIGSWGGGLSLFRPETHTFVHYTEANGLPNSVVYGILEDKQGQLWLSTNKGISCFNLQTKTFRNFYEIDGLQGDEFNTRSFFKSSNDCMYFGGINGLTYFNPNNALKSQKYIPKTVLVNFYAEGKPGHQINENLRVKKILHNKRVAIDWHIKDFSFEIAGLGYSLPAHTSYRYRITPFQKEWITLNNRRFIHFTNLPPGKYTLQIKAANSEGQWEAQGLIIEVEILGPFWRTWWFITLCIVVFIGGGTFWYFYRTHQLKKKALKLQNTVNERTQEIQLKNEEIAAQNEELQMQAEMLTDKNASLETIKKNLENKVKERTYELTQLNEDLLSQNTRLEQFAFITAHNIRGPIARIQGLLQILPENEQNQIIKYLHVSVNELDQVIRDLVTILDVRHGVDQHFEEIDIEAQLQETLDSLREDIEKRNAVIKMDDFAPLTLVGVKPYFKSVFHNLIHNALKYSKDDEQPIINIAHQATDTHYNISIADNGLGIEMRYAKEKIFHLYQRFHPERPGKGFGLYLVKTQLEAMGANIAVKSKLGIGTTFTISFPLPKKQLTADNSQA